MISQDSQSRYSRSEESSVLRANGPQGKLVEPPVGPKGKGIIEGGFGVLDLLSRLCGFDFLHLCVDACRMCTYMKQDFLFGW